MKIPLKTLMLALAVAALAAALLAPAAGAEGRSTGPATGSVTNGMMGDDNGSWCGGGIWNGSGHWGGTGMWGTGTGMQWLTDNPAALEAWLELRADHRQAMQTWYASYQADLTSAKAQQALHDLWSTFWTDMKDFYELYGNGASWVCPSSGIWNGWQMGSMMGGGSWNPRHMWGTGYGASWMTSHPAGFGQWLTMRGRQMSAVNAWWRQHNAAPASPAARAALKALGAHQQIQARRFYRQHHLSTSPAMMHAATGGWMGLGGMWGGFGW